MSQRPSLIRRLMPHPGLTVLLIVVWMLLLNSLGWGGLLLAVVLGVAVAAITSRFWPDRPRLHYGPALWAYLALVVWDIVVASLKIGWIVLTRRNRDLRPGWLVVPTALKSPEAVTALAATISLTPGTVSADISTGGDAILVHILDVSDPEAEVAAIKDRYERRLMRIFP